MTIGLNRAQRLGARILGRPAAAVVVAYAGMIVVGTGLLMLPVASTADGGAGARTALFTATSAGCVTGLVVVDTDTYWTGFGQAVLLVLMQLGGLGLMTAASLLSLLVARRLDLRTRLLAQAETRVLTVRRVLAGIVVTSLVIELVVWAALSVRFVWGRGEPLGRGVYLGLFHTVSAYNNAGFALWPDNLISVAGDPFILVPLAVAFVLGGLGYPVLLELRRERRPGRWSLHTKLTLTVTAVLVLAGPLIITATEWNNPATLAGASGAQHLLSGVFSGLTPRTAGFNTIDYAHAEPATLLTTIGLMFVGAGSAGTGGGIKVTTLAVLAVAMVAEVRGDPDADVFSRRLSAATLRQAITVTLLAITLVGGATFALLQLTRLPLDDAMFEATSAFATVGLSTGITADLPVPGQLLLVFLMFVGRVGTVTVASALALRTARREYRYPEARPIVG